MPLKATERRNVTAGSTAAIGGGALGIRRGKHAGANNRIITTDRLETRVFTELQHYMLDEDLIEIYVEEYRAEFAKRTRELSREGDRLKKRHGDAVAKIERLVEAVANGAGDFVEIRDVLAKARCDRDQLAEQISQLQQLPAVMLHPAIVADYRRQVARLNIALGEIRRPGSRQFRSSGH